VVYKSRNETGSNVANFSAKDNGIVPPGCADQGAFDFNQQEWHDFLGTPGQGYEYRVIALDCNETESAITTTDPTTPVTFPVAIGSQIKAAQIGMRLAPNPTSSTTTLSFGQAVAARISIIDAQGRSVYSTQATGRSLSLPTARLAKGLYKVVATTAQGVSVISLVKE
jgi:hypothetical protein